MNDRPNSNGINWRKVLPVAFILLVASYIYARPHLEKMLGVELPVLGQQDPADRRDTHEGIPGFDDDATLDGSVGEPADADSGGGDATGQVARDQDGPSIGAPPPEVDPNAVKTFDQDTVRQAGFEIVLTGRNTYETPAGLIYGMGPRNEHRIDHVLRHSADQPDRDGSHGVFDGSTTEILQMIDQAYEMIQADSPEVRNDPPEGNRTAYTINFKRRIGYKGGRSGARSNNPSLRILKLILQDGNRVVTAYPYR
ncbi:MAG: hypothetical protein AAF456_10945 [Planctomycetota bacterium]